MKLTKTSVNKLTLPRDQSDVIFFDDDLPGFGLRVRSGGSRKFVVDYRQGGIRRRFTIGSARVLTLEEARTETARATRRFVRRQRSWFRRDPRIRWLSTLDEPAKAAVAMLTDD